MKELIERLVRLTGPDRESDGDLLCAALGWEKRWNEIWNAHTFHRGETWQGFGTVPMFTASIDAAMTLVPKGLRLMLAEWDDEKHLRTKGAWQAVLSKPGYDASFDAMKGYRYDHAPTPAIALCIAALRARSATEPKEVM